jgi:hypothetical protein
MVLMLPRDFDDEQYYVSSGFRVLWPETDREIEALDKALTEVYRIRLEEMARATKH